MKRLLAVLLTLVLALSLAACSTTQNNVNPQAENNNTAPLVDNGETQPTEKTDNTETPQPEAQTENNQTTKPNNQGSGTTNPKSNNQGGTTPTTISEQQAKSIVLSHAGLTENEITRYRIELDRDDGRWEYEISFDQGRIEYDSTLNAQTGHIIESDRDIDD